MNTYYVDICFFPVVTFLFSYSEMSSECHLEICYKKLGDLFCKWDFYILVSSLDGYTCCALSDCFMEFYFILKRHLQKIFKLYLVLVFARHI